MTHPAPARLLVVDDEALNRTLVKAILARSADPRLRDSVIVEADSLAAARAALGEHAMHVVLLDIRLPDGNGLDLAAELTRWPSGQRPAVIALTAGSADERHAIAAAATCDAVLLKPYSVDEFEAVLAAQLARLGDR